MIGGWLLLAALVICFDRGLFGSTGPIAAAVGTVVPPQSTSTLLSSAVTGLITLNSIVFFVLVMAVQHQSSNYSPVVLDQFLRRRSNQAFFGILIGEAAFCMLILTLVPTGRTVLSGAVALVAVVATLVLLLVFIYSTVDQMRPSSIVWMIEQLALTAHAEQLAQVARCRPAPRLTGHPAHAVHLDASGYVVGVDLARLGRALDTESGAGELEVEFEIVMGEHVVPGSVVARIRGGDAGARERLAAEVTAAVTLGRMPDLDRDPGHAVDQLGNIAWTTAAGSDPEGARVAIRTLHSLLAHWAVPASREDLDGAPPLPIVYRDRAVPQVLDALTSVVGAAGASGQHQSCSYAIHALARVLPQLTPGDRRAAVDRLHRVLPTVTHQIFSREIEQALTAIHDALHHAGLAGESERVTEIRRILEEDHRPAAPGDRADTHGR
ncbi:hypothetical protein BAY60_23690 [Prauserella muralis]|uniref:DUF2254 domain-containing protein n=1 Tax=Prauserella muralis TaxID=588067 RepID=A0A2V4AQA8_9PSEU|nr:hypothetical protein BAY60_23690 [Prauserella muralis]